MPRCPGPNDSAAERRSAHELLFQVADDLPDIGIHFHAVLNQPAGVQHGPMVATAECVADSAQRGFRHLAREEHGDLAWEGDALWPAPAGHVRQANIEVLGHSLLNSVDVDCAPAFLVE